MLVSDDILQKLKEKDRSAFELVFKVYYSELCAFANKYVQDKDVAEEIVQDLFCYLWQKLDKLLINTSIKSYLYQSVRNRSFNYLKKEKVKAGHEVHILRTEADHSPSEKIMEVKELEAKIKSSIDMLPEKCRIIFKMSREDHKKYKEIAEELNLSVKTIENQMGKALKHLRSELGGYLPTALLIWLELMMK
jgi:RNA polymerase sigma-70 factor, ECF subfamily